MPLLIDGHNLIPKVAGLSLTDLDDELDLIKLLQEYARLSRKQLEVYFDNAQPGQARSQNYGSVVVKFVRSGIPADEEIRARLAKLGKGAKNWVVVSSDNRVQTYARASYAQVKTSDAFAQEMQSVLRAGGSSKKELAEPAVDEAEVNYWLEMFQNKKKKP